MRPGSAAMVADPARYLNVALFGRVVCEVLATVVVAAGDVRARDHAVGRSSLVAAAVMVVVSYVLVGVAPRTLALQHPAAGGASAGRAGVACSRRSWGRSPSC